MTLDLVGYPITARLFVLGIALVVGWAASKTGERRWRSGVTSSEFRAAYRSSSWFGSRPGLVGRLTIILVTIACAVYFALPELFGI